MKRIKTSSVFILIFILFGCTPQFKKHYLSSEIEGTLTIDRKPLIGASIIRFSESSWYDKEPIIDSVKTDKNGIFTLKERTKFASFTLLHQPVIKQFLRIKVNNKECEVINLGKGNYDKNGEFNPLYKDLGEGINLFVENNKMKLNVLLEKKDTISW